MFLKVKKHWIILIPALVIGFIIFIPNIVSINKAGNFSGIYPMFNDDESYYLAITKEVYDGNYNSGNTFIKEYKNSPALQPLYFEVIPSLQAKILNISIPQVFVLNDFFLPFLGVVFLYIIIFSVTESRLYSFIFSSSFYFIFLGTFSRPISPQLGFPFLLMAIFIIWKLVSKEWELKNFIILNFFLGLVFGLLVYVYPFYWSTIIVLYMVSSLSIVLTQKNFIYWFKGYLTFSITTFVIHIPYLINSLKVFKNPFIKEASFRNGLVLTHWPGAFFNVAFILICLPIVYLLSSSFNNKKTLLFSYSVIISAVFINWQNIITGKVLQFSSHFYLITILFIFILISISVKQINISIKNKEYLSFKKIVAILLSVGLILIIIYKQKNDFIYPLKYIVYPSDISNIQRFSEVATWLGENTENDSVVYSFGGKYDSYIPIYTKNNVYLSWYAGMSLMPDEELEDRWAIEHFWDNVDENIIKKSHRSIWINKFQDTYANKEVRRKIFEFLTGNKYPENILIDEQNIKRVLQKYQTFKKQGFEKALKTYYVDYVILDTKDEKYSGLLDKFSNYKFLTKQFEHDGFVIYKVE